MILCDLCGQAMECLQEKIEGRVFGIRADCTRWLPFCRPRRNRGAEDSAGIAAEDFW